MDAPPNYIYLNEPEHAASLWAPKSKGGIIRVPILRATDEHLEEIRHGRGLFMADENGNRRSLSERYALHNLSVREEAIRQPKIAEVYLHPEFDVLLTGGPLGTHMLNSRGFENFPDKLEQFDDEQVSLLSRNMASSPQELLEIRDLEIRLAASSHHYRHLISH